MNSLSIRAFEAMKILQTLSTLADIMIDIENFEEDAEPVVRRWMRASLQLRDRVNYNLTLARHLIYEPFEHKIFMRMSPEVFEELLVKVEPFIARQNTQFRKAICPRTRLLATLRVLITGDNLTQSAIMCSISRQSLGVIFIETCDAIIHVLSRELELPSSPEEWFAIAEQFEAKWGFPHCLGSIDGLHVPIEKPPGSGSKYYNYKKFFSIVLLGICDSNCRFIWASFGANGSAGDAGIFEKSTLWEALNQNRLNLPASVIRDNFNLPFVFIGDQAFRLRPDFMKPHKEQTRTADEYVFDRYLSRSRRTIENCFGHLVSRFEIFKKPMRFRLENVNKVVNCCLHLHNFLKTKDGFPAPAPVGSANLAPRNFVPNSLTDRALLDQGKQTRADFKNFLLSRSQAFHDFHFPT